MRKRKKCPLCRLKELTHWYSYTDEYVICDCEKCKVPMLVWRKHIFPGEDKQKELEKIAIEMFPERTIDRKRRAIPEHYHFHLR